MLGRAEFVGTSRQGSDDTVFGGRCGAGVVASVEVSVSGLSVDICGFVRMDEEVKEGCGSVGCSRVKVRSSVRELMKERKESVCCLSLKDPRPSSTKWQ